MLYHVKITFNKYAPDDMSVLEDDFTGAFINDNAEILFLYQHFIDETGQKAIERISIPIHSIEIAEIKPIYEDN